MRTKRYLQNHVVYQRTEMIPRNPLASPVRGLWLYTTGDGIPWGCHKHRTPLMKWVVVWDCGTKYY